MTSKISSALSASLVLAAISLAPGVATAQFLPPPPIAPAGPPPAPAGGPPPLAGAPRLGPGGPPRAELAGPAPRLGPGGGPRGNFVTGNNVHGGAAVLNSARATSINVGRSGGYGYAHGGSHYGYRATYTAAGYAAGASAGYAYGRSAYESETGCYYVHRRHRRILICD